jgi:hypothetical protein
VSTPSPKFKWNLASPSSFAMRIGARVRVEMFDAFMAAHGPSREDTVLDIGVTSDQSHDSSNYFEQLYRWKDRITAAGLEDSHFLEAQFPGLRFVQANACKLPFADGAFDLVHSSAVLEHVGTFENQAAMVSECLRVARRGIFLTTPNRWFPIEFHTQLPLVHWLPKRAGRVILHALRMDFFAQEANLNLMTEHELRRIANRHGGWSFRFASPRLCGLPTNILLIGRLSNPSC